MVKKLIILILFIPEILLAQNNASVFQGEEVKTFNTVRLIEPYFCEYLDSTYNSVKLVFQPGFKSMNTPEELLLSAYSGAFTNLFGLPRYNYNEPDTSQRNYLILIHKLTFIWQGNLTAIVKFREMKNSLLDKPSSIQMQYIDNIWKPVNISAIEYIENFIFSIRTNVFWELYAEKNNIQLLEVKSIVKDKEGFINIRLLSEYINLLRDSDLSKYKIICDTQ